MGKFSRLGNDLYQGRKSYDFIGHGALWYAIPGTLVGAASLVILVKGMNFGIEFTGGTEYTMSSLSSDVANQATADELASAIGDSPAGGVSSPQVTTAGKDGLILQMENVSAADDLKVRAIIKDVTGASGEDVSKTEVGASWGQEVAKRALIGVGIFLTLVVLFIWGYFREWKMSVAALIALFHDIALTVGVSLLPASRGPPAAVTGLLAILGF